MSIHSILASFARDTQLHAALILIVADFVLGVLAAVKMKTFRLGYVSDFARADLLGKVVPWFALFALGKVSAQSIGGIDFGTAADVAWGAVVLALGGSIAASLADFGINLPPAVSGRPTT